MYQLLRGFCRCVSIARASRSLIRAYNLPQAGVSLVRSLVEALVLRHPVLGVDHTMARRQSRFSPSYAHPLGKSCGTRRQAEQQLGAFACVGWREELTPFWRLKMKMRVGLRFEKCFVVE